MSTATPPPPGYGGPYLNPDPTPRRRKKSKLPWILGGIAVLALLLCLGVLTSLVGDDDDDDAAGRPAATEVEASPTRGGATTAPARKTTGAKAPTTVGDGTWVVGRTVAAGTYELTEDVVGTCIWRVTKAGTNGADFIAGDISSGGRPEVTLKAGQQFDSTNCGTWKKID